MKRVWKILSELSVITLCVLIVGCTEANDGRKESHERQEKVVAETPATSQESLKPKGTVGDSRGYSVKRVKRKILGYTVKIPVIIQMEDQKKQKILNQMIQKKIKRNLKSFCGMKDMPFNLWHYGLTVKYAGRDEISILGEINGYAKGAPHPWSAVYTINLDVEQEREIPQKKILPKKYRKAVEELILNQECTDVSEYSGTYRDVVKMLNGENTKNLVEAGGWKYIDVYHGKSKGTVGVVINTVYAVGGYAVYEVDSTYCKD